MPYALPGIRNRNLQHRRPPNAPRQVDVHSQIAGWNLSIISRGPLSTRDAASTRHRSLHAPLIFSVLLRASSSSLALLPQKRCKINSAHLKALPPGIYFHSRSLYPLAIWAFLDIGECGAASECKDRGNGRSPRKPARPAVSSATIPTCENPGATPPRIEYVSPKKEASSLTSIPLWAQEKNPVQLRWRETKEYPGIRTSAYINWRDELYKESTKDENMYSRGTRSCPLGHCQLGSKSGGDVTLAGGLPASPLAGALCMDRPSSSATSVVVRMLVSHQGEPGLIPDRLVPGFSHVGIVSSDAAGRRVFSAISRSPHLLHSGAAPYSPRFACMGSQDLDKLKPYSRRRVKWVRVSVNAGKEPVHYAPPDHKKLGPRAGDKGSLACRRATLYKHSPSIMASAGVRNVATNVLFLPQLRAKSCRGTGRRKKKTRVNFTRVWGHAECIYPCLVWSPCAIMSGSTIGQETTQCSPTRCRTSLAQYSAAPHSSNIRQCS
ncbi:hypothetical protein PR048_033322 [Dryococelus australis]|uniref:Uncharacterized protein n=1 Tax=Dryococelus australis TaxID=614101 RepID=A0ABQ9G003_9NEOP|nr:hypothetical protein PR048_033322 [Dryococelus australis]